MRNFPKNQRLLVGILSCGICSTVSSVSCVCLLHVYVIPCVRPLHDNEDTVTVKQ